MGFINFGVTDSFDNPVKTRNSHCPAPFVYTKLYLEFQEVLEPSEIQVKNSFLGPP